MGEVERLRPAGEMRAPPVGPEVGGSGEWRRESSLRPASDCRWGGGGGWRVGAQQGGEGRYADNCVTLSAYAHAT